MRGRRPRSPPNTFLASWPRTNARLRHAASTRTPPSRALSMPGRRVFRRWPPPIRGQSRRSGSRRHWIAGCSSASQRLRAGLWSSLAFWRGLAAAAVAALGDLYRRAVPQSAGRAAAAARRLAGCRWQRRQLSRRLRRRPSRGRPVACLRRARRRQGFRAVDDRGQECAGLDGRHPGRRRPRVWPSPRPCRKNLRRAPCLRSASSRPAVRRPASRPALWSLRAI